MKRRRRERVVDKPFLQRLKFKYRVSFLDENTLEEAWYVRLSRLSVFFYLCLFFIITFFLFAVLIITTPIRYYLPGYGDEGNRETVIAESMRADSLQNQMDLQGDYLDIVKDIIAGNIQVEEVEALDSFVVDRKNTLALVEKSAAEKNFVEHFEDEEKFNLLTIGSNSNENAYVFFRPVRGILAKTYNPAESFYGISVITSPNENVLSVLDGTVIFADYSFDWGWVIQVQHEGNFISIYKNNTRLLKSVGQMVRAGENIAVTGDPQKKDNHFYFELWNQGNAINPENVIIF